jgi:DNA-binding CsgD family transcriptional regulator
MKRTVFLDKVLAWQYPLIMPYKSQKHHQQSPITAREIEMLALLAIGMSNEHIAEKMGISEKTIDNLLASVRLKTHINSRVLLAFYAYGKGYVSQVAIKTAIQQERRLLQ